MDENRIDSVHYCEKTGLDSSDSERMILSENRSNRVDRELFLIEDSFVEVNSKLPALLPVLIVCVIFLMILIGFLLWKLICSFLF